VTILTVRTGRCQWWQTGPVWWSRRQRLQRGGHHQREEQPQGVDWRKHIVYNGTI